MNRQSGWFQLPGDHRVYPWIAAAAVAIMLARCIDTTRHFSHTWDEPYHIGSAVALYESGRHTVDISHPPLAWTVAAVPLRLMGVEAPKLRSVQVAMMLQDSWQPGRDILLGDGAETYWRILTAARLAMLVFPVILCFYLYLLSRWLANGLVAMLSVVFLSTDPIILGHSALVVNDLASAAGFLAAMYYGLRWIASPSFPRAAATGLAIGLAISCKFSTLVIIPALGLVALIRPLSVFTSQIQGSKLRVYFRRLPGIRQIALCALVGFVALWATYFFQFNSLSKEVFYTWSPRLVAKVEPIKNIPIPMPGFFQGMAFILSHSQEGHPVYLNGEFQNPGRGWWYYFPEALAIKEPIGVGLALVGAILLAIFLRPRRPWRWLAILLPPGLFALALTGGLTLGIRHLMPVLPLMYLFICFEWTKRRAGVIVLLALIAVSYAETFWRHPDYLSFFNVAVGGPSQGERYLLDSNLDWAQDVHRLGEWLKSPESPKAPITLRLYGLATPRVLEAKGIDITGCHDEPHDLFIISKSVKYGFIPDRRESDYETGIRYAQPDYSWLKDLRPIKQIGNSIEVYDLRGATTRPAP